MKRKNLVAFVMASVLTVAGFTAIEASADIYTIHAGDTLYNISQQYDTTFITLKEQNDFLDDVIYIEDLLDITPEERPYIIERGDTLYRIALAHDITVSELQEWNDLNSDLIFPGDELTVSEPEEDATLTEMKASKPIWEQPETIPPIKATVDSNVARTMTVEATAYTAYCDGCSGTTANGTNLRANPNLKVIAVDPRVIPLGTKVWVEGYGEAIAADTGGAIKGNKIDVFIPNLSSAYEWGRRTVTIKILN